MFRPTTGLDAFAAGALTSPIKLLCTVTVVPPVTERPLIKEAALLADKLYILFLKILVVVPKLVRPTSDVPVVDKV